MATELGAEVDMLRWIWVDSISQPTHRTTAHLFDMGVFVGRRNALCGQVAHSKDVRPCIRVPLENDQCYDCREISGIEKLEVRGDSA